MYKCKVSVRMLFLCHKGAIKVSSKTLKGSSIFALQIIDFQVSLIRDRRCVWPRSIIEYDTVTSYGLWNTQTKVTCLYRICCHFLQGICCVCLQYISVFWSKNKVIIEIDSWRKEIKWRQHAENTIRRKFRW